VIQVDVEAGDSVKKEDLLIKLDSRDALANFEKAKSEYERYGRLVDQGGVSRERFEAVKAQYINARTALGYTVLKAPNSGVVVEKDVQKGDLATPGKPLLTLNDPNNLRFNVSIREGLEGAVKIGDKVRIKIDALNQEVNGIAEEVVPHADPASRSYLVKIGLTKIEGLRSGMFGRLYFAPTTHKAIAIPSSYIKMVGQLETVLVMKNGQARVCYIRTGKHFGDLVEVLSGLEEGDTVIISK
jgi:RND family efflux transporter MFP subunit